MTGPGVLVGEGVVVGVRVCVGVEVLVGELVGVLVGQTPGQGVGVEVTVGEGELVKVGVIVGVGGTTTETEASRRDWTVMEEASGWRRVAVARWSGETPASTAEKEKEARRPAPSTPSGGGAPSVTQERRAELAVRTGVLQTTVRPEAPRKGPLVRERKERTAGSQETAMV